MILKNMLGGKPTVSLYGTCRMRLHLERPGGNQSWSSASEPSLLYHLAKETDCIDFLKVTDYCVSVLYSCKIAKSTDVTEQRTRAACVEHV